MSNAVMSLIVAISASAWIYAKMYRSSGGENKSAITVAAISGVGFFVVLLLVLNMIFKS